MYSQSGNMHHGQTLSLVYTVCVCVCVCVCVRGGGKGFNILFVLERFMYKISLFVYMYVNDMLRYLQ